jgi:hypothetical protein
MRRRTGAPLSLELASLLLLGKGLFELVDARPRWR